MSVILQTGVAFYREDENDSWHPLVIKADTDLSSLVEEYNAAATGKTWSTGELCLHDAKVYVAVADVTMPKVWTAADWSETTLGAQIGGLKTSVSDLTTEVSKVIPVITGSTNNSGYAIAPGEYFEANKKLYKNSGSSTIAVNGTWSTSATELTDKAAVNDLKNTLTQLNNDLSVFQSASSTPNDLNTVSVSGLTFTLSTTAHSPGAFCVVYTLVRDSNAAVQLALRTSVDAVYYRRKSGGTWYDWKTLTFQ